MCHDSEARGQAAASDMALTERRSYAPGGSSEPQGW